MYIIEILLDIIANNELKRSIVTKLFTPSCLTTNYI